MGTRCGLRQIHCWSVVIVGGARKFFQGTDFMLSFCLFFRLSNVNDKCNRERATNGPWPLNVQRPLYSLCSFEPDATVRQNLVQAALRSTSKHLLYKCVPNCPQRLWSYFGYPWIPQPLVFQCFFQLAPSGRLWKGLPNVALQLIPITSAATDFGSYASYSHLLPAHPKATPLVLACAWARADPSSDHIGS